MHGDPNPEAIQMFGHLEAGIRIAVIGFFIQLGALYKDHPALLLPSSKRPRQPCIVNNCCIHTDCILYTYMYSYNHIHTTIYIYTFIYTYTCNYIHIYTYTYLWTHIHIRTHCPFSQGWPTKIEHIQVKSKRWPFTVCLQKSSSLVKPSPLLQATHINFICPMRFDAFPLDTQVSLWIVKVHHQYTQT